MMLLGVALVWAAYYALHSLLATSKAKALAARYWPAAPRFYRLVYNQLSVWGFLAAWSWQEHVVAARVALPGWVVVPAAGLVAAGLVIAIGALKGYDLGEFAGWRYVRTPQLGPGELRTSGLNAWVRHPLYLGLLVLLAGAWLLAPTGPRAVFGLVTGAYVLVGLRLEEHKLREAFGEAYLRYQQQVPALWPRRPQS